MRQEQDRTAGPEWTEATNEPSALACVGRLAAARNKLSSGQGLVPKTRRSHMSTPLRKRISA